LSFKAYLARRATLLQTREHRHLHLRALRILSASFETPNSIMMQHSAATRSGKPQAGEFAERGCPRGLPRRCQRLIRAVAAAATARWGGVSGTELRRGAWDRSLRALMRSVSCARAVCASASSRSVLLDAAPRVALRRVSRDPVAHAVLRRITPARTFLATPFEVRLASPPSLNPFT